jgi:hypothetical protein
MNKKFEISIGLIIVLLFSLLGFFTISDYGLAKHGYHEYIRGEAFLHYLLTGNKDYTDIPENERCFFQSTTLKEAISTNFVSFAYFRYGFGDIPDKPGASDLTGYTGGLISALGCSIFYKKLGLLGIIDAHNSMFIIIFILSLLVVYFLSLEVYGVGVATLSTIFLALMPRLIGHAHNNYRDMPIFSFGIFAIWAFWKGTRKKDWRWIVLSGIFWGLCLVNKLTALFIPFITVPWLGFLVWRNKESFKKSYWIAFILFPLVAGLTIIAVWPFLWHNTLTHIKDVIFFYFNRGVSPNIPWRPYYVPFFTLITTPIPLMILGVIGFFPAIKLFKNEKNKTSLLIIIWLLVPILSFTLSKTRVRSGIRYFMIFYPALTILAGLGAQKIYYYTFERLKRYKKNFAFITSLGVQLIFILLLLFPAIESHPYQAIYFNSLIGGLKGAKTIKIPFLPEKPGLPGAVDYWGNSFNAPSMVGIPYAYDIFNTSYRRAFRWLNKKAEPNSLVLVWFGSETPHGRWDWLNGKSPKSPYPIPFPWANNDHIPGLRQDLKVRQLRWIENIEQINDVQHTRCYVVYLPEKMLVTPWNPVVQYCLKNLKPIYSEESQGAPVFLIYKFS